MTALETLELGLAGSVAGVCSTPHPNHTHSLSHTRTHARTYTHTHTHTLSLAYTHIHTRSLALSLTHSLSLSLSPMTVLETLELGLAESVAGVNPYTLNTQH